jgi:hypothetical protein
MRDPSIIYVELLELTVIPSINPINLETPCAEKIKKKKEIEKKIV